MVESEFPRLVTAANSKSVLRLCNRAIRRRDTEVTFDLSRVEFVTPFGVTTIAATITKCMALGKEVFYQRPAKDEAESWLSSISFSRLFQVDEMSQRARDTSIELRQLRGLNPIYIDDLVSRQPHESVSRRSRLYSTESTRASHQCVRP
jgi:hypothetical protein